jgi:hypothetical protein
MQGEKIYEYDLDFTGVTDYCSHQLIPDSSLSFSSATSAGIRREFSQYSAG